MSRLAVWLQPETLSKPNNVTSQTRLVAAQNRPQIREGFEIGSSLPFALPGVLKIQ